MSTKKHTRLDNIVSLDDVRGQGPVEQLVLLACPDCLRPLWGTVAGRAVCPSCGRPYDLDRPYRTALLGP